MLAPWMQLRGKGQFWTPDILTLIAMGLPMCLLYESCIWIAWLVERRRSKFTAG